MQQCLQLLYVIFGTLYLFYQYLLNFAIASNIRMNWTKILIIQYLFPMSELT